MIVRSVTVHRRAVMHTRERCLREGFPVKVPHGNAASVVGHSDGAICFNGDVNARTVTRDVLIERISHDFPHHVKEPGSVIDVADIHARPSPDHVTLG